MQNKTKSNLRIAFSSLAFISFVLFFICNHFIFADPSSYLTYSWRLGTVNYIFLLAPFVALLTFSIMERKWKNINGRVYVLDIFFLYFLQGMILFFVPEASDFSIFCSNFVSRWSEVVTAILCIRIAMLVLIPIAHKLLLKMYSVGMLLLFGVACIEIFSAENIYFRSFAPMLVTALMIDALFHIALYFFSDLMEADNTFTPWLYCFGMLMYPIVGNLFNREQGGIKTLDLLSDESENTHQAVYFPVEYKKILICALAENDEALIPVNAFLGKLSEENVAVDTSTYIPKETYMAHLTVLLRKAEEINTKKPGLISEDFTELLHELLNEQERDSFRLDVITVAKLLTDHNHSVWLDAVKQYFEA